MSEYRHRPGLEQGDQPGRYELKELLGVRRRELESAGLDDLERLHGLLKVMLAKYGFKQAQPDTLALAFEAALRQNEHLRKLKKDREEKFKIFAVEYILSRVEVLKSLYQDFLAKERESAQKEGLRLEAELKQKADLETEQKVNAAKERALAEWSKRKRKPNEYIQADLLKLNSAKAKIREQEMAMTPEERVFRKEVAQNEALFAYILNESRAFGAASRTLPADEFDDIISGVDFVVELKKDAPLLLIDLTHDLQRASNKLLDHVMNPVKELSYPVDIKLKGALGVPVVLGNSFDKLKEFIDDYFKSGLERGSFDVAEESGNRGIGLADMLTPQVREQKEIINEAAEELGLDSARLQEVNRIYDSAASVLGEVVNENEKGPLSGSKLSEKESDPWYNLLSHPAATLRETYPRPFLRP